MLVHPFIASFSNIGEQVFLRCDPKYRHFFDVKNGEVLANKKNIPLKVILSPLPKHIVRKGILDEEYSIVGIDTSEPRDGQLRNLPTTCKIASDKLLLKEADIIIAKLGAIRGYVFDNTAKGQNLIGSTELIPYRLLDCSYYPAFLKYLLLLPVYLSAYACLQSGKTPSHWRMNPLDLLRIKIPEVPTEIQSGLLKKVSHLQERINELKSTLPNAVDIINRVFAREFRFSLREYEKRAKQNTYEKSFADISKEFLLRSSVKFHHPKYDYLGEILTHHSWVKLKTICADRIHRGVQPKYDAGGEILVVKTLNLKNEYLDFSESEHVSKEFSAANPEALIKQNDILVSSTGEGRGKVDIFSLDESAIADSHISIVRLRNDINPYYILYFMRSLLGKLQLETLEMAIKGTPEIYWHQLEQMWIINLSSEKQDVLVKEIRDELQELQHQRAEIQRLRLQIDSILMEGITREVKE